MVPSYSHSHLSAGRGPTIPARGKRLPHGSALPLAIVVIVLAVSGASGNLEGTASILA